MKKVKVFLYSLLVLLSIILVFGMILAFYPFESKVKNNPVTEQEAAVLRENYSDAHELMTTSDGEILFIRRWNPGRIDSAKKEIAVLIYHGITAHSGPYEMAGIPISEGGYTTFGLDYRGHGLSGGNRGDSPNKERWLADLAESVEFIKGLGFSKLIILGHSLGVASAICAANELPAEIDGLVLLSGAYEGKQGVRKEPSLFDKMRIISGSVFRPSFPVFEYYREGMTGSNDPLFNFRYTLRFLTMLDVSKLRLPESLDIPVLVGAGDQDELFEVEKVKEFFDLVPGNKKEFLVMKNTFHARIPRESWEEIVKWIDKNY